MLVASVLITAAGSALSQIQVPHGPVPTPGQAPQAAALYGPPPQSAAQRLPPTPSNQGSRRSENLFLQSPFDPFFSNAGFNNPGFHVAAGYPGFFSGYGGLSPQQNGDGSWNFVALPIPLENQTIPEGFPRDQVAQAKLWGPIYREGQGWIYGDAGTILVPKYPPYAPPRYVTPPALQPPAVPPTPPAPPAAADDAESAPLAEGTTVIDTKTGRSIDGRKAESSKIKAERLRKKDPRK